jgi:Xaa-Pro aminopeptidase
MRPGPLHYLAGYTPTNGFACLHVGAAEATLVTDQPWDVAVARESLWLNADAVLASDDLGTSLAGLTSDARRVGVAGWEILPVGVANAVSGVGRSDPTTELIDVGADVAALRMVKSDEEITLLREACTITSAGAAAFAEAAVAGATELEVAASVDAAMRSAGSGPLAFPLVLGAGPGQTAGAVPLPGDRTLHDGDLVLLNCGTTFLGYCGDMSRTLVVGSPSGEQRCLLDTALATFEHCAALLEPGTSVSTIHAAETLMATRAGFELPFLLGHGIGCQNWEPPLLGADNDTELETGMVVTLEPGLYVPGLGGVRLENTFLITQTGAESLTVDPMNLWEV